jgi:hypothetical protein
MTYDAATAKFSWRAKSGQRQPLDKLPAGATQDLVATAGRLVADVVADVVAVG